MSNQNPKKPVIIYGGTSKQNRALFERLKAPYKTPTYCALDYFEYLDFLRVALPDFAPPQPDALFDLYVNQIEPGFFWKTTEASLFLTDNNRLSNRYAENAQLFMATKQKPNLDAVHRKEALIFEFPKNANKAVLHWFYKMIIHTIQYHQVELLSDTGENKKMLQRYYERKFGRYQTLIDQEQTQTA